MKGLFTTSIKTPMDCTVRSDEAIQLNIEGSARYLHFVFCIAPSRLGAVKRIQKGIATTVFLDTNVEETLLGLHSQGQT